MNQVLLNVLVAVSVAALIGGVLAAYYIRQARLSAQLEQEALARGWRYERINQDRLSGHRLGSAPGDITWTLEATAHSSGASTSPGLSNVTRRTRWWSQAATLPGRLVLIGPRASVPAESMPGILSGLGNTVIQMALRVMIGDEADQLVGLEPAQVGTEVFRQRYMVYAHHPDEARALLDAGVESALINWPSGQQVVIKLGQGGLEVSLPGEQASDMARIESLVNLGTRLVVAWRHQ